MRKILCITACALALCSCAVRKELSILHVNDTHSHHEALRTDPPKGGIIERAAILDSVRNARGPQNVLLLHAGDFNQGSSYYTKLGGYLEVNVINAMSYDCITLGNHEFDNGIEDLALRLERVKCPVVCSNVDFGGTPLASLVSPYAIIEKAGKKIGIIGAAPDLRSNVAASISQRIRQIDTAEAVGKWAEYLHKVEKCDLIILLSHLGYEDDLALVPQTRYLDLVIGGHTHTFVEDLVYPKDASGKKVPVVTDGCWGLEVGEVTVSF